MPSTTRSPAPLALLLAACTSGDPTDTAGDTATATEASLVGTSTRTREVDGVQTCHEVHDLTGTPTDCALCDLAFALLATPVAQEGDCPPDPALTWAEDAGNRGLSLGIAATWAAGPPVAETVQDAVLQRISQAGTYYGGTAALDWRLVGYRDGGPLGDVRWDGRDLEVDVDRTLEDFQFDPTVFQECGPVVEQGAEPLDGEPQIGALATDLPRYDAWTFDGAPGVPVALALDNRADGGPPM
ncbi:MAG: hypothetical protein R3F59_39270, partial [Myxococcota bacterium]